MTTRALESIYQEIATLLNEAIPQAWRRAWIEIALEGESSLSLTGWYEPAATATPQAFALPPQVVRDLAELRRRIHGADGERWRRGTFHLDAAGHFSRDLEYD